MGDWKPLLKADQVDFPFEKDDLAGVGVRRETFFYIKKAKYHQSLMLTHQIAKALETTIDDLFILGNQ